MASVEYAVLFSLAGATLFGLAGVGWQYRSDPVGRWFAGLCAAGGLWSLGYAASANAATFERSAFWYAMAWIPYEFMMLFLLLFTLEYTGYVHWVTRPRLPLFLAWPVTAVAVVATSGAHDLVWVSVAPPADGGWPFVATPGPWFLADTVYAFCVALLCLGLLLRRLLDARHLYRKQTALLLAGVAVPMAVGAVSLLTRESVIDLTPLSFPVAAAIFLLGIRRYRFLDVVPVAHRLVLEHMDDAMVVAGTEGEVLDFNAAAARLFHLSGAAVGGRASAVFGSNAVGSSVVVDGEGGDYATTVEGELRQFEVDVVEIRDDRDAERGTLYLFHDVTERHRREQWFRTLTENATDITLVLDADARIEYVGESVCRVLGIDPETLDHEDAVSRAHEDDRETVRAAFVEALDRPGETIEFGCRVRDADGDHRAFDIRAKNLLYDPIIQGVVVNAHDVTEREANERRLERQNEQLDAFASVISHDLRNPLNVAQGYLDLLRDDPAPEHIDRVARAHERMESIVSDVLALARSGSRVGETEAVDLREAAEAAWANVVTRDATLTVAADASVAADRTRLLHLFENLFRNSVEHGSTNSRTWSGDSVEHGSTDSRARPDDSVEHGSTNSRTASGDIAERSSASSQTGSDDSVEHGSRDDWDSSGVTAGARSTGITDAGGPTIRVGRLDGGDGFYVADDGPGVPSEDRERVFESGYSTSGAGTGLGLAIVRAVADAHGWKSSCVAADGGGARFEFRGADVRESPAE